MNGLPFAEEKITIYNKIDNLDPVTNKTFTMWISHVLHGCFWQKSMQTLQVGTIQITSDDYNVQVPYSTLYVPYEDYINLPYDEQLLKFTGNIGDLIVRGEVDDVISWVSPDSSVQGLSVTKFKEKYKNRILTVKAFINNASPSFPLRHYLFVGS